MEQYKMAGTGEESSNYTEFTYDEIIERAEQLKSTLELLQSDLRDFKKRKVINEETEEMQDEADKIIKELNVINAEIASRDEQLDQKKAA